MTFYTFSANGVNFGDWESDTLDEAKETFAEDAGYKSWAHLVEETGDDIEVHVDGVRVK